MSIAQFQTLEACPGGTATCAAIGPKSGQLIATGGHDGVVRVWRVGRDAALGELTGLRGAVAAAAFDPGEHLLMAGAETGGVTLFDLPGMRAVRKMRGHSAAARTVAFHPGNPAVLVSGGADGAVRLWDARSGSEYVSYKGHSGTVTCCVFSPDGRWLAVGDSDGTLRVWDLGAGKALATLVPSRGPRGGRGRGRVGGGAAAASAGASTRAARSAWFHPTDLLLLSSGDDRAVRCWDVDTGRSPGGAELPMLHPVTGAAVPPEARPIRWGRFVPGPAPVSATLPAGASAMLTCSRDAVRGWAVGGRVETEEGGAAVEATPLGAERVAWGDLTGAWLGRGAALGDDPPPAAVVAVTPSRHGAVRVFAGTPSPQLWEERQAALWRAGDPTKAVLHAIGSRDADVAASACERADLEAAGLTMKQVSQLLAAALREAGGSDPASRPASAVSAASDGPAWPRRCVASLALQACHMFAGFVHATLGPARAGGADGGVSMAEEERRDRCERLLASLRSCRSALAEPGARGREAEAATRSQALLAIDRVLLPLAL